jgi:hypothetical protein
MEFIGVEPKDLIDELFDQFKAKGKLRELPTTTENPVSVKVKECLRNREFQEALDLLTDFLDGKDDELANAVVLLSGRLSTLNRRKTKGALTQEAEDVERNQISEALLGLAYEVKGMK